jgi:hypothetical protein
MYRYMHAPKYIIIPDNVVSLPATVSCHVSRATFCRAMWIRHPRLDGCLVVIIDGAWRVEVGLLRTLLLQSIMRLNNIFLRDQIQAYRREGVELGIVNTGAAAHEGHVVRHDIHHEIHVAVVQRPCELGQVKLGAKCRVEGPDVLRPVAVVGRSEMNENRIIPGSVQSHTTPVTSAQPTHPASCRRPA